MRLVSKDNIRTQESKSQVVAIPPITKTLRLLSRNVQSQTTARLYTGGVVPLEGKFKMESGGPKKKRFPGLFLENRFLR